MTSLREGSLAQGSSALAEVQVVVIAKEPLAGTVKTRLCPPLTASEAAHVAAAALADTLEVVGSSNCRSTVVAFEGESDGWVPGPVRRRAAAPGRLRRAPGRSCRRRVGAYRVPGPAHRHGHAANDRDGSRACGGSSPVAWRGRCPWSGRRWWVLAHRSSQAGTGRVRRRTDEYGPHRVGSTQTTRNTGVGLHGYSRTPGRGHDFRCLRGRRVGSKLVVRRVLACLRPYCRGAEPCLRLS